VRVIEMAEATTAEDREAVFRFWYSVYVEEMGRYRGVADHVRRELRDPEDDRSRIVFAREDGEVIGSYRLSWGGDGFSERQIRQYSLQPFLDELPNEWLVIGERTMVAESHRGGTVWTDLAMLAGPICDDQGAFVSFGACEPHLVSYYAQFNNRPYAMRQFVSEESGYLVPIISFAHGIEPFGDPLPACIQRVVRGESSVRNGEVIGTDAYTHELHHALAPLSSKPSLFSGLDKDDVEHCCVHSSLITCAAGDHLLRVHGTARNPFMVVSGKLEARRDDIVIRELGPGDLFGESGWFGNDDRHADVFAVEEGSRVLALSLGTLRKLGESHPALALSVTANAAKILWSRLRDERHLTG
jgi:hypothetical protein